MWKPSSAIRCLISVKDRSNARTKEEDYAETRQESFGSFSNWLGGYKSHRWIIPASFARLTARGMLARMPLESDPRKHRISEITRRDIVDALLLDKSATFHGRLDLIS